MLGYDSWLAGLEAGVAAHHAGMVPPMKEAVEEAFAAGLLKVVFATETLSLGINMPARSVVDREAVEVHRRAPRVPDARASTRSSPGRAGRRGIDDVGYVVVLWDPFVRFDQVAGLASRRTYALTSSFRPTYNMAANLVQRYPPEQARHLLNLSFAQYHADRDVVVARHASSNGPASSSPGPRAAAAIPDGDVEEYRRAARRARRGPPRRARRPGQPPRQRSGPATS